MRDFNIALLVSIIAVLIGLALGLDVWNSGWSLDLVDLAAIPMVAWLLHRVWRKR